jgi:transcriptional regulator with GAF, ATPase, and Fis domain
MSVEMQFSNRVSGLIEQLVQTAEQTGQLQTLLERTLQALGKRGIQIQVDFGGMLQGVNQGLDRSQKSAQYILRQISQLQELVHTSALLTSSLEFDRVLEEVIDTVIKLTGAERAYLMLKPGGAEELKIQVARNAQRESINKDDITFSHGIINTAIEQRAPLLATNAQDDERFKDLKSVMVNQLRSIIIVPLMLKDQVVGVLYADNRIEQGVFSQENVPLLNAFANQAAIAISNARLFEKVREDLKEAQRQVERLLIEIDKTRVEEKVSEITESDYFKEITSKARDMRRRSEMHRGGPEE